jgi:hypothetical protein
MHKTARALESLSATDRELRDNKTLTEAFVHALSQRRATLRETIPQPFLAAYDALGRMGRRPAVVPMRKSHCGGCYLRLPPQVESAIRHRQSLPACPHCHRLLYSPPPEEQKETSTAKGDLEDSPVKGLSSKRLSQFPGRRPARKPQLRAARSARRRV